VKTHRRSLLFLDEPTSGLDGQSSYVIMQFLRKLAKHGQSVLCTIHQPSAALFAEFDELLLLKGGGKASRLKSRPRSSYRPCTLAPWTSWPNISANKGVRFLPTSTPPSS